MQGNDIGVRDGILEQKHMDALGRAVWLYLWLLNKQTKSNKVLGGKPVTYQMFKKSFPDVPRITYVRWLAMVEAGGYASLVRTPRGYVVTIGKPKKWVGTDVSKTEHQSASDVSKMDSDVSKTEHAEDVSKTEHPIKIDSLDRQRQTSITNVMGGRRSDIDEMFELWGSTTDVAISSKLKANRYACSNLLKKYGKDRLGQLIKGVAIAQNTEYAPRIADFCALQSKLTDLLVWGRKEGKRAVPKF